MHLLSSAAPLLFLVVPQWIVLKRFRGHPSTGMSKRALFFGVLVYGEAVLGSASVFEFRQAFANVWFSSEAILLHELVAVALVFATAWVVFKALEMDGYARVSAIVVALLTLLSCTLVGATSDGLPFLRVLHYSIGTLLLSAAVWHAYELRIYPAR